MNAAILQRLVWKEYRVLRSFWLATLVLAACAGVAWRGLASWYERPVQLEDFFVIAAVITSLFALGAGGTAFATEHEVGTVEFLRRLPLGGGTFLCGKLVLSAAGLVALKIVLWSVLSVFATWLPVDGERVRTIWWCSVVSELELFAWGMLFSLLTRQPLMAITWGIVTATGILHLVPALLRSDDFQSQRNLLDDYSFAMPGRAAFALALLASVVWLSTKWIRSPQPLALFPGWFDALTLRRRTSFLNRRSTIAIAPPLRITAKAQWLRLIWLQWRQSWQLLGSLTVPLLATGIWKVANDDPTSIVEPLFVFSTGIFWLAIGICVFHGQQTQFQFRYFAEHGVSPGRVWWGHQLGMLPLLLASVAVTFVVSIEYRPTSLQTKFEMFGGLLLLAILVFAVGQLAGMLARQILIVGALGFIGLLMHFGWMMLLHYAITPPASELLLALCGFLPLILAWFLATRSHVSNWLLECRSAVARGRLALCLIVPWIMMAVGLMTYRALEIPNIGIQPPTREQLLTLSPDERQTAGMYQAVINSLRVDINRLPNHDELMQQLDQRLQQSPEILTNILAATRRPIGAFFGDPQQQNAAAFLILRVLHHAELRAFGRQDFDQSVVLHAAMRRVLLHWRQNTNFEGLKQALFWDNNQIGRLMYELRAEHWSPEQLRELADRLAESTDTTWRKGRRAWEREFREAFDVLRGANWPPHFSDKSRSDWEHSDWMLWIPGEQQRASRLLNIFNSIHTQNLGNRMNTPVWQKPQRCRWNTPCANLLMYEVDKQGRTNWHGLSLPDRWQAIQVWLQMRAAKEKPGHWPETFDGLKGLGTVKTTPVPFAYGNWEGWIEYLPKGLIGERAPEPFTVRGLDHLPFEINGDEPCVVLFEIGYDRTKQLEEIRRATGSETREESLRGLHVEPLDPVSSAVGKEPPAY